ncbi:MAG: hypothetical protein J6S07_06645 [Bacteroidaceae bacterium]|nr:hypothetical protein [Bacteroidaceae bacterium]
MKTISNIQTGMAIASFIVAICFGVAGFIVPPEGEIHESVLYLIAQFMLLTASLFGVGAMFSAYKRKCACNASAMVQNAVQNNSNNNA